jgi:hypothetical protein
MRMHRDGERSTLNAIECMRMRLNGINRANIAVYMAALVL